MDTDTSNLTESAAGKYLPRPLNIWGLVVLIVFYVVVLLIGVWASIKNKTLAGSNLNGIMLAERKVGPLIGVFTMTATWVGGGYINGTAEYVFRPGFGLAWTQAMWGFSVSIFLGGIFFAKRMRESNYVTMLDPFTQRYGHAMAALMFIPVFMTELFWSGAILGALGSSLYVILGVSRSASIIISTVIAVFYTVLGGLYSVVLTDLIQIVAMFVGLWVCVAFGLKNPAVTNIVQTATGKDGWLGEIEPNACVGQWLDSALLFIAGGIPVQAYLQRVLSADSARTAQIISCVAGLGCLSMSIPAVLIGAIAKSADWNATDYRLYFPLPIAESNYQMILPLTIQFLTPPVVAIIGLGAVSAAVMSSADSSLLASSSVFSWNLYRPFRRTALFRHEASNSEVLWVMRVAVICHGILACMLSIMVTSTYDLFLLCGDFIYVVGFPQFLCVLFLRKANAYGALVGFVASYFLRLVAGEPTLDFEPLVKYWHYDDSNGLQCFPFRTFAMFIGLVSIIIVSYGTYWFLPAKWDVWGAVQRSSDTEWEKIKGKCVDDSKSNSKLTTDEKATEISEKPAKDTVGRGYDNLQFVSQL